MSKRIKLNLDSLAALVAKEYNSNTAGRGELRALTPKYNVTLPKETFDNKISRGVYEMVGDPSKGDLSFLEDTPQSSPAPVRVPKAISTEAPVKRLEPAVAEQPKVHSAVPKLENAAAHGAYIPLTDPLYVAWGNHSDIKKVVKSGIFMPTYITGATGNGKTMTPEQVCASLKRECIRVNITKKTNEDDLIGGFRLIDGETVWSDGPVIEAMKRGAVLLLDEIDLGSDEIMCLQSVLEGKAYYIKKTNRLVQAKAGFNVIATANTKGDGQSEEYTHTNPLNEAFKDRFPMLLEQDYPTKAIENKILTRIMNTLVGDSEDSFISDLCIWADIIRATYKDGGVERSISTRRLVDIVKVYSVFHKEDYAIDKCTARFDDDTREAFRDLWLHLHDDPGDEDSPPDFTPDNPF